MTRTRTRTPPAAALDSACRDLEAARDTLDRFHAGRRTALAALADARRTAYRENPGLYLCPQVEAILEDIKRAVEALQSI